MDLNSFQFTFSHTKAKLIHLFYSSLTQNSSIYGQCQNIAPAFSAQTYDIHSLNLKYDKYGIFQHVH